MKAIVDADLCTGCGLCEDTCPDVFKVGDDGISEVLVDDCSPWAECAVEAVEECPESAISVVDG